jgi:hypothetical protein
MNKTESVRENSSNASKTIEENQKLFDQRLTYISAGALFLLTDAFVDSISKFDHFSKVLYLSLVFLFGFVLICTLLSYLLMSKYSYLFLKNTNPYSSGEEYNYEISKINNKLNEMNAFNNFIFLVFCVSPLFSFWFSTVLC